MKRTIVLGDTHGRTNWKDIVNQESSESYKPQFIFIGDYFDTHDDVPARQQMDNFLEIVEFKRNNPHDVVLLFGNHDFHYLRSSKFPYSGFQELNKVDIQEMLHNALDKGLMQMCFREGDYLFSHAGVTKTWCRNNEIDMDNIDQSINDLFYNKPNCFEFSPGSRMDMYGEDITQTPIWVRPRSLKADQVDNYIQVVGHTTQPRLITGSSVILIDTLGTSGEYLALEGPLQSPLKVNKTAAQ